MWGLYDTVLIFVVQVIFLMYAHTYLCFTISKRDVVMYIIVCHAISDVFSLSTRLCRRCCCCCRGQPGQEIAMFNGKQCDAIRHDSRSMALQRSAWPIAKKLNNLCAWYSHTHTHTHTRTTLHVCHRSP